MASVGVRVERPVRHDLARFKRKTRQPKNWYTFIFERDSRLLVVLDRASMPMAKRSMPSTLPANKPSAKCFACSKRRSCATPDGGCECRDRGLFERWLCHGSQPGADRRRTGGQLDKCVSGLPRRVKELPEARRKNQYFYMRPNARVNRRRRP
jgi:hypothetical protein